MRWVARCLLFAAACISLSLSLLFAQRPYDRYLNSAKRGVLDDRVHSFVSNCVGGTHPRPQGFYSHGGWFGTDDLAAQIRDHGSDDDATAYVWSVAGKPRAVYQWTHDGEFDRDVVACVDAHGKVTHAISHYMPGSSEPDQHWIYIHTLELNPRTGHYNSHGRYTDAQGRPRGMPHMSSEDRDFIAGERTYKGFSDFDFARMIGK